MKRKEKFNLALVTLLLFTVINLIATALITKHSFIAFVFLTINLCALVWFLYQVVLIIKEYTEEGNSEDDDCSQLGI